jgi:hypothetical protein
MANQWPVNSAQSKHHTAIGAESWSMIIIDRSS